MAPAIAFTNQVSVLGVNIAPNGVIQYQGNDVYDMSVNTFVGIVDFAAPDATRANLGFSTNLNTLWTATNYSNARSAVGLGATNSVTFAEIGASFIEVDYLIANSPTSASSIQELVITGTNGIQFNETEAEAATRANLGLPLAALTNTSNVTAMRALGGSTNTNEPYSGTVALTNTNVLTFSNGVLLKIQ